MEQDQSNGSGTNGVAAGTRQANAGGGSKQFMTTWLYVGDLDLSVTDSQLYDLFNQVGQVVYARVCRNFTTRISLGYGYVNYSNLQDAARAMEVLNFTPLNGKSMRVRYSQRDPSTRKSGSASILIKNLDKSIDNKALYDTFSRAGNVVAYKVATDGTGRSKGYGFVIFETEESVQAAINKFNGMLINGKKVYVGHFVRNQQSDTATSSKEPIKSDFACIFIKNMDKSIDDEALRDTFSRCGNVLACMVSKDGSGQSKGFGFVQFDTKKSAQTAVDRFNGMLINDKKVCVGLINRPAGKSHPGEQPKPQKN